MGSRFTALPVSQGDAFLLERSDGTSILVDGGISQVGLPAQIANCPGLTKLDVVVCTHADADHANGLIGLLEAVPIPVHEVWLPGRWTERLGDLCERPLDFAAEVADEVYETGEPNLETFADSIDGDTPPNPPDTQRGALDPHEHDGDAPNDDVDLALATTLDRAANVAPARDAFAFVPDGILVPSRKFGGLVPLGQPNANLWLEAMEVAARIRSIAIAAFHHGAKLRWFDFQEASARGAASGGNQHLVPLNSVELTRVPRRRLSALRYLALSVANRESLVFEARDDEHDSSVIFTADSDLATCTTPAAPARRRIVTAPHHGAEANAKAYTRVASSDKQNLIWVRSDCNSRSRPGKTYRQQLVRACTLCQRATWPKQTLRLFDTGAGWEFVEEVKPCQCP